MKTLAAVIIFFLLMGCTYHQTQTFNKTVDTYIMIELIHNIAKCR